MVFRHMLFIKKKNEYPSYLTQTYHTTHTVWRIQMFITQVGPEDAPYCVCLDTLYDDDNNDTIICNIKFVDIQDYWQSGPGFFKEL